MSLPNFWTSHIAQVLAGDQPCLMRAWLGGRFKFDDRGDPGSLARWKADHSLLLQGVVGARRFQGWKCDVERFFRVTGERAVVSGKADLILQQTDKRPRIVDCKSGKAKDSDVSQVLAEMVLIPLAWKAPTMQFEGEVVYGNGNTIVLEPREAEAFKPKLFAMVNQLATMERPQPSPSRDACLFCNVPDSECDQRWKEADDVQAVTTEF